MSMYELSCEFDVARRIGWEDDAVAQHVDDVLDRLRQGQGVRSMSVEANMDTGRVELVVGFDSLIADDPQHHGALMIGVAIRASGGMHQGLLPLSEEAVLRPEIGQRSGLRTPIWNVRRLSTTEASADPR